MARRKTFRAGDALSLADETKVGSQSLIFNDDEVVQLLRTAIERKGKQGAFARRIGIERTGLNLMVNGKRPLTAAVLKALGLRKVYTPE